MVHPCSSTDTAISWKKSRFILLERIVSYMADNLLIAVPAFGRRMLTSLSVHGSLLPRYMNLPTNFRSILLKMEMTPSRLKHMNFVLFAFK